jgi:hypothetical protein
LHNSDGELTDYYVEINDAFTYTYPNGVNASSLLGIPYSASSDFFFGNTEPFHVIEINEDRTEPTGGFVISNLVTGRPYSFSIFGARGVEATDNRTTKYTITGETVQVVYLDALNNTSHIALVKDIKPAPNGTISIKVEKESPPNNNTNGFYYLNALKMWSLQSTDPGSPSLTLKSPNGGERFGLGSLVKINWESFNIGNIDIEYSTDGSNWTSIVYDVSSLTWSYDWTPTVKSK